MSRNNANFRANFLEKISVSGVEFGDSLSTEATRRVLKEQILADASDVDLSKLRQFVIKHQIPHCYHIAVWKLILGISSCYPEGRLAIEQHRREEAEMLLRSLQVMRKTTANLTPDFSGPADNDIVSMIKLANSSVSLSALSHLRPITFSDKALFCISKRMILLCIETGNWIDAYWLTLRFYELFDKLFNENVEHLNALISDVRLHVVNLHKLREQPSYDNSMYNSSLLDETPRVRFFSDSSKVSASSRNQNHSPFSTCLDYFCDDRINLWFRSGGSSLFHEDPLYRLWDKLSAGESIGTILKYTLIEVISLINQQFSSPFEVNNSFANINLTDCDDELTIKVMLTRDVQLKSVNYAIENASRMGLFGTRKE